MAKIKIYDYTYESNSLFESKPGEIAVYKLNTRELQGLKDGILYVNDDINFDRMPEKYYKDDYITFEGIFSENNISSILEDWGTDHINYREDMWGDYAIIFKRKEKENILEYMFFTLKDLNPGEDLEGTFYVENSKGAVLYIFDAVNIKKDEVEDIVKTIERYGESWYNSDDIKDELNSDPYSLYSLNKSDF